MESSADRRQTQEKPFGSAREESRTGAAEAIRALVEAIVLEPDGDQLKLTLKGGLAGMLNAARDSKRPPETGDLLVQIKVVFPPVFSVAISPALM